VSEEAFHVQVQGLPNKYRLCFAAASEEEEDDSLAVNHVQLGFHIRVQSAWPRALPDVELGPDAQRALSLLEAATTTEQHWHHLMDHFDFLRNREGVQWQLLRQTFAKIMGWTILEAFLVVTMAIAQVCYWKSFFEQRRYL
jgi:emp24/gp25L/p24 family/GOLD